MLQSIVRVATVAIAAASMPVGAAQVELSPAQDTTLYADNYSYGGGAGGYLFIGNTAVGAPRRALLRFDLSVVPPGSTITSAALSILVDRNGRSSEPTDEATLHRLVADWGEGSANPGGSGGGTQASPGDATWAYRFFGDPPGGSPRVPWATPGGDFIVASSGRTFLSGLGRLTFASTPGLVADVQRWVDDPSTNFGWIMLGNESRDGAARRLLSREAFAAAERPELLVVYQPIPEPSGALLVLAGAGLLGACAWRSRRARPARAADDFAPARATRGPAAEQHSAPHASRFC